MPNEDMRYNVYVVDYAFNNPSDDSFIAVISTSSETRAREMLQEQFNKDSIRIQGAHDSKVKANLEKIISKGYYSE